jgi:serine/threonine protein kinase
VTFARAGQRYGQWELIGTKPLGKGGNGEVWRVTGADGRPGAIKILFGVKGKGGRYRLGRFRDEIAFLLAHGDVPGILPLLDSDISEDPAEVSWYVMPVATPIRDALGNDPDPGTVVAIAAGIAETLASLAEEGVAHRDIKPDNLFQLNDRPVVGDFGLVTYPDKDPRTDRGRKLGPLDYMAPEMRRDADTADPQAADVWALAKTLWVLLTGAELPLPGTHRPGEASCSLSARITFRYAAELDLLLEKTTMMDPGQRISMAEMARELRACAVPPAETRADASLGELRDRIAALTAVSRQRDEQRKNLSDQLLQVGTKLANTVSEAADELRDMLTFDIRSHEMGYYAAELLERVPYTPYHASSAGWLMLPVGQEPAPVSVTVAMAFRELHEDDAATDIAALLRVNRAIDRDTSEPSDIWAKTYYRVPFASAQQANVIAEIREAIRDGFAETLRQVIAIMSSAA